MGLAFGSSPPGSDPFTALSYHDMIPPDNVEEPPVEEPPSHTCAATQLWLNSRSSNRNRNALALILRRPRTRSVSMLQVPMTDRSSPPSSISTDSAAAQSNGSSAELKGARKVDGDGEDEELRGLLMPDARDLPLAPPSAVESNFVAYFAPDFMKPGHDQYVYRHPNGLCVVGLAPTHVAFRDEGGVTGVDFNVGKSDRSAIKVTGKRKKNAQHLESNSMLCKVCTKSDSYVVRCCVKGSLLEVNERLIKQPDLLNSLADREGYIAIIMPRPADWLKVKATLLGLEEYKRLKEQC